MIRSYIALGSNLEDPVQQVRQAIQELRQLPSSQFVTASSLYRSAPMGPSDQPDYINAVVAVDTELSPHALLDALQMIEQTHGRQRGPERWGPRTLDLDVLLYGEQYIDDERLTVPHRGIAERAFVLYPLQEIVADDFTIPGHGELRELISRVASEKPECLSDE